MDIQTKDGILLRNIPDGTPDEAIKARIAAIRAESGPKEGDPKLTRFGRGMMEPVVGAIQLAAHAIPAPINVKDGKPGPTPSDPFSDFRDNADRAAKQIGLEADAGAPDGVDWMRLGGNLATLAPTAAVGGPATTIPRLARAGAAVGGISGATAPVQDAENFGATKAGQVVGGAVAGAVLTPAISRALSGIGNQIGRMVTTLKRAPNQIQVNLAINSELRNAGIDPAVLQRAHPEFMRQIGDEVRAAMKQGGTVDGEALVRRVAFQQLGIKPTQGQVTRDATQWGKEDFLRQTQGGAPLAEQYTGAVNTLNSRLGQMQGRVAQPLETPAAGARVMQPLEQTAQRSQNLVGALYDIATSMPGQNVKVQGSKFANDVLTEIERDVAAPLPGHIASAVNNISTGKMPLDVNAAQRLLKAVNKSYGSADDATRYSLDILKRHLDDALESDGGAAALGYKLARGAAAQRFAQLDAIPALKAVARDEIAPDDFIRKFVTNGKVEDLANLRGLLSQTDPAAWNQLRGQVLHQIREAATKDQPGKFLSDRFNTAVRSLQQSGKLQLLFTPDEIGELRAIGIAGRAVTEPPPGVRITGQSGAAKATEMLTGLISKLGRFGQAAVAPAKSIVQNFQATAATQPGRVTTVPPRGPLPLADALAAGASGGAVFPLAEALQ